MSQLDLPPAAVQLKRAYDPPEKGDGVRVLVDRLWARGIPKAQARLDAWMKELGPSSELRQWFGHRPERWDGFQERYGRELAGRLQQLYLAELQSAVGSRGAVAAALQPAGRTLTLVYGARDRQQNEAVVLRDYLLTHHIDPPTSIDVADAVLATVAAVAAAQPDERAPTPTLTLFTTSFVADSGLDAVLLQLVATGVLRAVPNGWQLTARGKKRLQQV